MGLRRIDYQHGKDKVFAQWSLESGEVIAVEAANVKRTYSGIQARIAILQDGFSLGYDTFNIERREDRNRLANACHKSAGKSVREQYLVESLRVDMDDFCAGLWESWMRRFAAEDLAGDPDLGPQHFFLAPYILSGGGTILFGPPGRGKSTVALMMAQSIQHGSSQLWPTLQAEVLFVNLERSRDSIKRRLVHVNQQLGLPVDAKLPTLQARGRPLTDIIDLVEDTVEQRKTKVLFLDSITRAGYGKLKEDEPANRIMDALNAACETWFALGHTPRQDESHIYGSQMFDAAADICLQMLSQRRESGTLGLGLQVTKANDIAFPPMQVWAMEYDAHGLSCFREAKRGEFPEVEAGKQMGVVDMAREYLLRVGEADASEIARQLDKDRTTVSRALGYAQDMHSRRDGQRILYSVKAV